MGKEIDFKNRDRLIQIGITISTVRRLRGMSQEKLAEKANISRSLISSIEAPGLAKSFSLEVLFNIVYVVYTFATALRSFFLIFSDK